jgi:iron complex transport system substrate-binding protein
MKFIFLMFTLFFAFNTSAKTIEVIDDLGRTVRLEKPARRIISLAPHITENLFAAGAGDFIVGAVSYSDYPDQAKIIPQVGAYNNFNIETILELKPDLIVGWKEGNQKKQVELLMDMGFAVYINESTELEGIAKNIRHFGILTEQETVAANASNNFVERLSFLRDTYSDENKISVFYQTWNHPLITVNEQQFIGRIIKLCGGQNIFADLNSLTPQVSAEAVIANNPSVIIASGMNEERPDWLDDWKEWSFLTAVKFDNLFFVPPDIIQRHSPRVLDGAQLICEYLQGIRDRDIQVSPD